MSSFFIGLIVPLCGLISLQNLLLIPAVGMTLIWPWSRQSGCSNVEWSSSLQTKAILLWLLGTLAGGIGFMRWFDMDAFVRETLTYQHSIYEKGLFRPMGIVDPIHTAKYFIQDLGWSASGVGFKCDWFMIVMLVLILRSLNRPLSRFALFYSLSHWLFCVSRYPVILQPLFVAAGLSSI